MGEKKKKAWYIASIDGKKEGKKGGERVWKRENRDFPSGPVVKRLYASNPWGTGLIPDQGTKIPTCHVATKKKTRKINNKSAKVVSVIYDCITNHSKNLVA